MYVISYKKPVCDPKREKGQFLIAAAKKRKAIIQSSTTVASKIYEGKLSSHNSNSGEGAVIKENKIQSILY